MDYDAPGILDGILPIIAAGIIVGWSWLLWTLGYRRGKSDGRAETFVRRTGSGPGAGPG